MRGKETLGPVRSGIHYSAALLFPFPPDDRLAPLRVLGESRPPVVPPRETRALPLTARLAQVQQAPKQPTAAIDETIVVSRS